MGEGKVRLGVVGLGWWGGVLADGVAAGDNAEVVSAFARTPETRQKFADERGVRQTSSYEEMLADDEIEGVLLATSHLSHAEMIEQAADAGKHVFVEKPFTLSVESGKQAIAASEKAGIVLQVGHNKRRQQANRRIKEMIDGGDLGTVVLVETHQNVPVGLKMNPQYWRASRDESPLGSMTGLGVHMFDTMNYLLGPVESLFTFSRSGVVPDTVPIDHVTSIVLQFASGAQGYLGTSFMTSPTVSVTVRGTGGTVWNEQDGAAFFKQQAEGMGRDAVDVDHNDTIADQLTEFANAVRGGPAPETGGAEGLEVISMLAAAVASAESGKAVSVADFR